MGQIVGTKSNVFRCNLAAIQSGGSKANTILAADEVWLIDTTNSLTNSLSGNCDAYIIGNGSTKASALVLNAIANGIISEDNIGAVSGKTVNAKILEITGGFITQNLTTYTQSNIIIPSGTNPNWNTSSSSKAIMIPLSGYKAVRLTPASTGIIYAFLQSDNREAGAQVMFANGATSRTSSTSGNVIEEIIPADANYLYLVTRTSQGDQIIRGLAVGLSTMKRTLNDELDYLEGKLKAIAKPIPYQSSGAIRPDGTINKAASTTSYKSYQLNNVSSVFLNGFSSLSSSYCLWLAKDGNGNVLGYELGTGSRVTYNNTEITLPAGTTELLTGGAFDMYYVLDTMLDSYTADIKNELDALQSDVEQVNHWRGKSWYAYGTSLTNTANEGQYAKFVQQMSGMIRTNKGISGGGLVSNTRIYDAIHDLTDGKTTADLITLECLANDGDAPFGTVFDTTADTFLGALADCIVFLQQNTTAQIVIIGSMQGRRSSGGTEFTPNYVRPDGTTYTDRMDAMEKLCKMYGVYFINPNWAMGYYRKTDAMYVDRIHHTELGGKEFGAYIWEMLKNVPLWYTSVE